MGETASLITAVTACLSTLLTLAGGAVGFFFRAQQARHKETKADLAASEAEVERLNKKLDGTVETALRWRNQLWRAGIDPEPPSLPGMDWDHV